MIRCKQVPKRSLCSLRHGQSRVQEAGDAVHPSRSVPFSALGVRQARLVAERLAPSGIGRIYSSEYERAVQTAEIIGKRLGMRVERRLR